MPARVKPGPLGLGHSSGSPQAGRADPTVVDECMLGNLCVFGSCENLPGMFCGVCDKGYEREHGGSNCTGVGPAWLWVGDAGGLGGMAHSLTALRSLLELPGVGLV